MECKKYNVLVTGVGAIIGYGIIKSLKTSYLNTYIVGMDIYSDAVGQYWCDEFVQAKYAIDEEYISFLIDIINKYNIDIVFFGTEQEIYRVNSSRNELGQYIKKLMVNRSKILELSQDKWKTYQFLLEHDLSDIAIPSIIEGDYTYIKKAFGNRFMLKPRCSYASKGIEIVESEDEFNFFKRRMGKNFMAQCLIGDAEHEYTVAVFGLGNGKFSNSIILKRKLSQEGATAKAEVIYSSELQNVVERLVAVLKPIGPTNFQFRYENGSFFLLEVNPRISSSTSIRTSFGYNEAALSIEYFLNNATPKVNVKTGKAVRYIDEVIKIDDRNNI